MVPEWARRDLVTLASSGVNRWEALPLQYARAGEYQQTLRTAKEELERLQYWIVDWTVTFVIECQLFNILFWMTAMVIAILRLT